MKTYCPACGISTPQGRAYSPSRGDWQRLLSYLRANRAVTAPVSGGLSPAALSPSRESNGNRATLCAVQRHLEGQLALPSTQRRDFERYASACSSLLAPIRQLPVEILSNIFHQSISGSEVIELGSKKIPALFLGQICSHWRRVSQSCGELWASFSVRIHPRKERSHDLLIVDEMLRRSGTYPLSLSFISDTSIPPRIAMHFARHCGRWRKLHVEAADPTDLLSLIKPGNTPVLRELSVASWDFLESDPLVGLADCPDLHSLTVNGIADRVSLRTYGIQHLSATQCCISMHYLSRLTGLSTLFLKRVQITDVPISESTLKLVNLPLRQAHLESIEACELLHLLNKFTLPDLTELDILPWLNEGTNQMFVDLAALIERSACRLTVLNLSFSMVERRVLLDVLEQAPELVSLSLHEHPVQDPSIVREGRFSFFLEKLIGERGHGIFLPSLKSLSLTIRNVDGNLKQDQVARLISRRSRLERFHLNLNTMLYHPDYDFDLSPSSRHILRSAKEDGMDISILLNLSQVSLGS